MTGRDWLVITGARSAIGRCVAQGWQARGGRVLGLSRYPDLSGTDRVLAADLSAPEAAAAALSELLEETGIIPRGFVHAAGVVFADEALNTTVDERRRMLSVNLEAAFTLMTALAGRTAAPASFVLISSVDAMRAPGAGPAAVYGAAKAGLEALVRHLAVEWGMQGIRINAIRPGPMAGGMGIRRDPASYAARTADRRLPTPEEVGDAALFLLGAGARGITGQILAVDHGFGLAY